MARISFAVLICIKAFFILSISAYSASHSFAQDAKISLIYPLAIHNRSWVWNEFIRGEAFSTGSVEYHMVAYPSCNYVPDLIREVQQIHESTLALVSTCSNNENLRKALQDFTYEGFKVSAAGGSEIISAVGDLDFLDKDFIYNNVRLLLFPELPYESFESNAYSVLNVDSNPPSLLGFCDNLDDTNDFRPFYICTERPDEVVDLPDRMHASRDIQVEFYDAVVLYVLANAINLSLSEHPSYKLQKSILETEIQDGYPESVRTIRGVTIVNDDYPGIEKYRERGKGLNFSEIFAEACPGCSGTGEVCGKECPRACDDECVESGKKKCCSNGTNGIPYPISPWE